MIQIKNYVIGIAVSCSNSAVFKIIMIVFLCIISIDIGAQIVVDHNQIVHLNKVGNNPAINSKIVVRNPDFSLDQVELGNGLTVLHIDSNGDGMLDSYVLDLDLNSSWLVGGNELNGGDIGTLNSSDPEIEPIIIIVNGEDRLIIDKDGRLIPLTSTGENNTFIGFEAGRDNVSGENNTFIGLEAGRDNVSGDDNTFIGFEAGRDNESGKNNNFIGFHAGQQHISGNSNNFIGENSGQKNKSGSNSNFIGNKSGQNSIGGNYNNFLGTNTGNTNETGSYNNFLGRDSGKNNKTGSQNNFFGSFSGKENVDGSYNNFIGSNSGSENISGNYNNYIGRYGGQYNKTGLRNNFFGFESGRYSSEFNGTIFISGKNNNYFGYEAGKGYTNELINPELDEDGNEVTDANGNTIYNGYDPVSQGYLISVDFEPNTGDNNNFFGSQSGKFNTTGAANNIFGKAAGIHNKSGGSSNYFGSGAGKYTSSDTESGNYNNYFGFFAGKGYARLVTGMMEDIYYPEISGYAVSLDNYIPNTGQFNNFFGSQSGEFNSTGSYNNYFGYKAGRGVANTVTIGDKNFVSSIVANSGSRNNFFGERAGEYNSTGSDNVFIGSMAGQNNTSGNNNVYIGTEAGSGVSQNFSNSIAIGNGATVTMDNHIVLGDIQAVETGGSVGWSTISDQRFKKNIQSNVPGLSFISALNPVSYNLDGEGYDNFVLQNTEVKARQDIMNSKNYAKVESRVRTGFLAQEVEAAANKLSYDFDGINKPDPNSPTSTYSISYSSFVVPLVKAVQEQQEMIEDFQQKSNKQDELIQQLIQRIESLEEKSSK